MPVQHAASLHFPISFFFFSDNYCGAYEVYDKSPKQQKFESEMTGNHSDVSTASAVIIDSSQF
jgi:hypothetical protein